MSHGQLGKIYGAKAVGSGDVVLEKDDEHIMDRETD